MKELLSKSKLWIGWKRFARAFARVNTEIIVFLFYFIIFSPFGLILKIFRHDPLKTRLQADSNWKGVEIGGFDWKKASHQS